MSELDVTEEILKNLGGPVKELMEEAPRYKGLASGNQGGEVLSWWKKNKNDLPHWAAMARKASAGFISRG